MSSASQPACLSAALSRANLVASAFARACVQLFADAATERQAISAFCTSDGDGLWPIPRDEMSNPVWVRARMTEDCADMIRGVDDPDTDAFGEHDLADLGWAADQVRAHGRFALDTALMLTRPHPSESRARPRAFGEARRVAMGAMLLASFGLMLGSGMVLAALLTA